MTDYTTVVTPLEAEVMEIFDRDFADWKSTMLELCTPSVDPTARIVVGDLDGGANFTVQSGVGSPDASAVQGFSSTSNPAVYESRTPITFKQTRDVPNLAERIASMVLKKFTNKIATDFWTMLGAGRTTAHPENGVLGSPYAANGGGTVYFVDNFDMTWINGGSGTQTNDHSLALSATNIDTLLAKRLTYKDRNGDAQLKDSKPYLVFGPSDLSTARNIRALTEPTYDGTGLRGAVIGDLAGALRAPAGFSSGAWALVWVDAYMMNGAQVRKSPVNIHVRKWPEVRIKDATDGNYFNIITEAEWDVFYGPFEGDLLYSKP